MRSKDKIRESLKFIIAAISIVFATYFFVLENRTIPYLIDKLRAQKFYNVFSKYYDLLNPFVYNFKMRKEVINMLKSDEFSNVLELGCGTGYTTEGLIMHSSFKQLISIDLNPNQLKRAKSKIRHAFVSFVRCDAYILPFRENVFDRVITAGMIEYINKVVDFFKEVNRVLKNRGYFLIAGPEYRWFSKFGISRFFYTPRIEEMIAYYKAFNYKNIEYKLIGPNTFFKTEKYAFSVVAQKSETVNITRNKILIENEYRI
jgi:Methylase involved in ubiquinone/menaquinone biosynthesis